jgi:hypothetical protein
VGRCGWRTYTRAGPVGTWSRSPFLARVAVALRNNVAVTDDELAAILVETAVLEPRTTAGVTAMFALAERLQKERPEFAGAPRIVLAARGSHAFSSDFAAQRMLQIVRNGRSAEQAVTWLRKAHETTRGVGGAVKALYGVKCSERIALSEDVVLLPYSELQSETSKWIMDEHERANEARLLHGFTLSPRALLYRPGTIEPLFIASPIDYSKAPPATWFDDLDTAALLLALTPKAIPSEVAHWFHYDDPDVALLGQFGLARHFDEIQSPFRLAEPTETTLESAGGLLTAYRRVAKDDQGRITLALQRLIRSRSQNNPGNRAIDLAIALEVLFMNVDRDEHSYKISMRLAKLLGGELAVRRTAFGETRKLYDLRSNMVHSGRAKNDWSVDGVQRSAYDLVEAGDVRSAEAIRKFLALGRIPDDWRDIELS